MPDATPIYGFPYPCPGETISPSAFSGLALAIDAKLLDVNNDLTFALNRPNFDNDFSSTQVITAGVDTVLTTTDSTYTISVAGVWVFWMALSVTVNPATITSQRLRVRQNGTVRFGYTQDNEGNNTLQNYAVGPIIAAAGDVITGQFLYTGTGTMTIQTKISGKLVCRIP